jgi:hypothetical protein
MARWVVVTLPDQKINSQNAILTKALFDCPRCRRLEVVYAVNRPDNVLHGPSACECGCDRYYLIDLWAGDLSLFPVDQSLGLLVRDNGNTIVFPVQREVA